MVWPRNAIICIFYFEMEISFERGFKRHFCSPLEVRITQSVRTRRVVDFMVKELLERRGKKPGVIVRGVGRCVSKCVGAVEAVKRELLSRGVEVMQMSDLYYLRSEQPPVEEAGIEVSPDGSTPTTQQTGRGAPFKSMLVVHLQCPPNDVFAAIPGCQRTSVVND